MQYEEFLAQFHIRLNSQQSQAVQKTDGAVLLLAVPGSGKTTALVARLGYMIFLRGIDPANILTMTYTVPAARDMQQRFASIFGAEYAERMAFRTINSVCVSILGSYARMTGATIPTLLEDPRRLLSELYQRFTSEYPTDGDLRELARSFSLIKNMRLRREEVEKLQLGTLPIAPIYDAYTREMKRRSCMDFDDQLVFARAILLKVPELLRQVQQQYPYLCVDEAQDTSKIQHEIIRILAGETGNLFMVGDEDQSIYGFRAAFPDALLRFERDYPGSTVLLLEENYRSTPEIVSLADAFIARNTQRHPKHMRANRPSGLSVRKHTLPDRAQQYAYLTELAQQSPDRETAILYRNNDSAVPLIDHLDRAGIPFRCRLGEATFFSSRTVQGVLDILTLALEPQNAEVFLRVYYKCNLPISKAMAEAAVILFRAGRVPDLMTALHHTAIREDTLPGQIAELHAQFSMLRTDSGQDAINRIRYSMGYGAYVLKKDGDAERLFLLSVLGAGEANIQSLCDRLVQLQAITQSGGSRESKLILSTIHSSKGLEYDRVILMDAIDGILPASIPSALTAPNGDEQKAFEEERRLFYVGATRAKNELLLLAYAQQSGLFVTQFLEKPKYTPRPARQTAPAVSLRDFSCGMRVIHKTFGSGTLLTIDEKTTLASIAFDGGSTRTLSLSVCVTQGLLAPENK